MVGRSRGVRSSTKCDGAADDGSVKEYSGEEYFGEEHSGELKKGRRSAAVSVPFFFWNR